MSFFNLRRRAALLALATLALGACTPTTPSAEDLENDVEVIEDEGTIDDDAMASSSAASAAMEGDIEVEGTIEY